MKNIQYTIFKFQPIQDKNIEFVLGILIYDSLTKFKEFRYKTDLKSLELLDDELDSNTISNLLFGIKDEINNWEKYNKKEFDLEKYIKYFLNDFRFSEIKYTTDLSELSNILKDQ